MPQTFTLARPEWVLVDEDPDRYAVLPVGEPLEVLEVTDDGWVEIVVPGTDVPSRFPAELGAFGEGEARTVALDELTWAQVVELIPTARNGTEVDSDADA